LPSPKERQPLGNITNFVQKLEYSEQLQSDKQVNFEDQKEIFDVSDDSRLTHLSVISSQTEPKKSPERRTMRFPIEANRRNLTWIVFNSEPQEHFVTLLNKLNKPMKLTCLIQNDNQDEFSFSKNLNFGEDDHDHHPGCGKVLDITIGAQCKRDIFVKYQPSNLGESEANLVLKPHGIARDKKTLKSKVQLKAYHFESYKVAIVCNEQPLTKPVLFVEETSLKILVKNEGHCSIFCKIIHAKSKHNFVLNRGQEKRLKIGLTTDLLSQPEDLTIFYGPEIARQIFKSTGEGAESSFLRGEDFKGYFDGDACSLLSEYRLSLAPLRFGAGIKGKIADSWFAGTPVITTPIGAESMGWNLDSNSESPFGGVVTNCGSTFNAATAKLFTQRDEWQVAKEHGSQYVSQNYNLTINLNDFACILDDALHSLSSLRNDNWVGRVIMSEKYRASEYLSKYIQAKNK